MMPCLWDIAHKKVLAIKKKGKVVIFTGSKTIISVWVRVYLDIRSHSTLMIQPVCQFTQYVKS